MTSEKPTSLAKQVQDKLSEKLSESEKQLINGKLADLEGFLNFLSDAHLDGVSRDDLLMTFGQILDSYIDMVSGDGGEPMRAKGVIMMGLRNQMSTQIIMAKEELQNKKSNVVSISSGNSEGVQ